MNAVDMTIGKIVWEEDVTENRQEPLEYALDAENECLKITFEPPLYPSDGTLRINFNGKIYTKGYRGMYRSNRLPNDLAETPHPEYYLLTNFKPSHARRCFPCWDEPSFKAVFEMCFVVPTFYTALSNMPLKASFAHRSNVQLHMVECMQTPSMSSHAVGFCLGKFEVHTELEKKKYGNYAAKLLKEFLSFFKDYIKCPFPLDKLDLVVLPDVCSVAVRNWGLITCRDTSVFADDDMAVRNWGLITCRDTSVFADDDSTPMFLQDVSLLLAREVAHQWFGNLVTMDWFNYLWLHQGLANFTSQLAVDKFAPHFRESLIEQVSGKPVVAIFKSWVTLPGYPLIRVSSKQEGSYRTFTLTQEKFCEHSANGKEKDVRSSSGKDDSTEKDPIWMIPITFAAENRENILSVVLDRKTTKVSILLSKVHWVSVNPGHYGFFRVRYSTDCFAQLISAIRKKNLPVFERMSLLSDLYSMILNGLSSTIELLNVLEAYVDETHYAVWKIIIFILRRLNFLLDSSDYYKKFQIFVNLILSRIADKTTFEVKDKEEHLNILRQTLILSTLVRFRNQRVLKEARKIFEAFQKGETIIPHSVRVPVYEAVLQNDDEETIRTFFKTIGHFSAKYFRAPT
ncbi:unnamed protein product [Allacma fusca]|uniref:Aminopeptidase n=1 Tax=Allacma fusca TaxID=39272 RepID=A0A8J2LN05_9HEXA|nr:unnamed protein product [Allacma fusca]